MSNSFYTPINNWLVFTFLFLTGNGFAQPDNKFILENNRFSVGLSSGLIRQTQFSTANNNPKMSSLISSRQLDFGYTFQMKNWGINTSVGHGFLKIGFTPEYEVPTEGEDIFALLYEPQRSIYTELELKVTYDYWLGKRWMLQGGLGGVYRFQSANGGSSKGQFNQNLYAFDYYFSDQKQYYLSSDIGIQRVLKNDNLLGFHFGCQYALRSNYYNGYFQYGTFSALTLGSVNSRGHSLFAGVSYTMTRAKKRKKLEDLFFEEGLTYQEAKKGIRKKKRLIEPNSIFIGVSGGAFLLWNKLESKELFLHNNFAVSWAGQLEIQKGTKNDFYWQAFAGVGSYVSQLSGKRLGINYQSSRDVFATPYLGIGYGKRLIGKEGYNFLNVSTGVMIGVNTYQPFAPGIEETPRTWGDDSQDWLRYERSQERLSSIIPTFYLDLNKDFRITNRLYFSLDYRLNLGIMQVHKANLKLTDLPGEQERKNAVTFSGTGQSILFGLKYKWNKKQ